MFNLSYTILTRNLVHGLQFKKKKKENENCNLVYFYLLQMYKKLLHQTLLKAAEPWEIHLWFASEK